MPSRYATDIIAEYAEIGQVEMYNAFIDDKEKHVKIGIFYKWFALDPSATEIYVGSTTDMNRRKRDHKANCNWQEGPHYMLKVYQYVRANGGCDVWNFEIIDTMEYVEKTERLRREGYWVKTLGATLNCRIPGRTQREYNYDTQAVQKEYRRVHAGDKKMYNAQWYINNADLAKRQQKERRIANKLKQLVVCECGTSVTSDSMWRHKKTPKHAKMLSSVVA